MIRRSTLLLVLTIFASWGCSQPQTPTATHSQPVTQDQDTVTQISSIVAEQMGVDLADVKPTTSLADLSADELDVVELIMEFEDHYDVTIPDQAITKVTGDRNWTEGLNKLTISKLAEIVEQQKQPEKSD